MSRFGNLFNQKPSPAPTPAPEPVVEEAPVVDEVVEEVPEEETHFEDMSKRELEAYGREHGIELDRRHSKKRLVEELEEYLTDS